MIYKFFLALIFICFASDGMLAQKTTTDVVYFKDGTIIHGQVLKYDPQGKIQIEVEGGSVIMYESSTILKMEKETAAISRKETKKRPLHIKENKWYHSFAFGNVIAFSRSVAFNLGYLSGTQLEYSTGYQFNQYFGLGLNVGIVTTNFDGTIPISANFRGYFMKTSASLFYDLDVGYGLSLNSFSRINEGGNGGLHLHPSIGVRFASTRKGHTTLELGGMIQTGSSSFSDAEKRTFLAITLRVGATF